MSLRTWDPFDPEFLRTRHPSEHALRAHLADIRRILKDPLENIFVLPVEDDPSAADCLIVGPSGTPYENGFFVFRYVISDDYPDSPPRVKLMNTGNGTVRFNPNLYADGKVCLSILGTWQGPGWKPSMRLSAVLLSIQSLMTPQPILNEPGFDAGARQKGEHYTAYVRHETVRVAVLDFVAPPGDANSAINPEFVNIARSIFRTPSVFNHLVASVSNWESPMSDGYVSAHLYASASGQCELRYVWSSLRERLSHVLDSLGGLVESEAGTSSDEEDDDDSSPGVE